MRTAKQPVARAHQHLVESLGGVDGLDISEFDVLSRVAERHLDRAGAAGERQSLDGVARFDGPVVAVLDHHPSVRAQRPVVATGHHLVTNQQPLITS